MVYYLTIAQDGVKTTYFVIILKKKTHFKYDSFCKQAQAYMKQTNIKTNVAIHHAT